MKIVEVPSSRKGLKYKYRLYDRLCERMCWVTAVETLGQALRENVVDVTAVDTRTGSAR